MNDETRWRTRASLGSRLLASLLSAGCALSTISNTDEMPSSVSTPGDAVTAPDAGLEPALLDGSIVPSFPRSEPRVEEGVVANAGDGATPAARDAGAAPPNRAAEASQPPDAAAPRAPVSGPDTPPRDAAAPAPAPAPSAPKPVQDAAPPSARDAALPREPPTDAAVATPFALSSSALRNGAALPERHRCDGSSPPLAWGAGPRGTLSYALVFRDLSDGRDLWILYDIPATVLALAEGVPSGRTPARPAGAHQADNHQGEPAYIGPCDLLGRNDLELTLYALDVAELPLLLGANASAASVLDRLESHDLARSKWTLTSRN